MAQVNTRPLDIHELGTIMQWMVDETWHVSLNILQACYALDPSGWIAAESGDGELIGSITGCMLDDKTAFGGFFIVRPDWRKRGVGSALWKARMAYLGDRNFGIDAVEARVKFDMENGFKHKSFEIAAYLGEPDRNKLDVKEVQGIKIKEFNGFESKSEMKQLIDYDSKMHKIPRERCMKKWVDPNITRTFTARDEKGDIVGFGCVQPIESGHFHIGPVFGDQPDIGKALLNTLMLTIPKGKKIGFDIPVDNPVPIKMAKEHDLLEELKLYRMYTKEVIEFDVRQVFAFTTMGIALV